MFGEINEKERLENLRLEISLEQERLLNVFHKYGAMAVIFDDGRYVTPDPEPEAISSKKNMSLIFQLINCTHRNRTQVPLNPIMGLDHSINRCLNPQAPVAQKIADGLVFRRFQGEEVEFFSNRT